LDTGNCTAAGAAGGDLTGTYPNPTIASLQGTTLSITSPTAGNVLIYNATNGAWENSTVSGDIAISETGVATIQANSVALGGDTTGDYVANLGILTGLSTTGNSGEGSAPTLNVLYGSTANTAVQGSTALTCAAGTGNLSGGGNSITLGAGGACGDITITNSPTFTGTLTVNTITATGAMTIGSTAQDLTLQGNANTSITATDTGNTTTVGFTVPTANTTLNFPALSAGSYEICTSDGNCSGAGVTLQATYDNSTNPELVLDTTRGALTVRDNATPIGANLLEVQNNDASTTYFAVTSSGIETTGTNVSSGDINTTGGSIQTNSTTRVDNSGNLVNIADITASGNAVLQGGNLTLGTASSQTGTLTLANAASSFTGALQTAALGQATAYTLPDPGQATADICLNTGNCADLGQVVDSFNTFKGDLTLQGTVNQITLSDNGTDTITLALPQDINTTSSPTFAGLTLGTASSQTGSIVLHNGTNANTLTLQPGVTSSSYTLTLPTSLGSTGDCIIDTDGTGVLGFQDCGSGVKLQTAYTNSDGGTTPEVKADSTRGALDIQDADTSINGALFTIRGSNAGGLGSVLFNVDSAGDVGIGTDTPEGALDVLGTGIFRSVGSGTADFSQDFEGTFPPTSPGTWDATSGDVAWVSSSTAQEGSASAASTTSITDSQAAWLEWDITTSTAAILEFYWKVSSEEGWDYLAVCVNNTDPDCDNPSGTGGTSVDKRISGEQDWAAVRMQLQAGSNTIRWAYGKDSSAASGDDRGWVDNIRVYELETDNSSFRVLNASDVPLFLVDTASNRVYIGDPSSDASTGALLVLDSITSDPTTAVNGSMYYNSTLDKFRCFEGGSWVSCVGDVEIVRYTSSGTFQQANFPGMKGVIVEGVGGGGGGGGAAATGASTASTATGGGGGGYFRTYIPVNNLAASETVTVGSGGAAGSTAPGTGGGGGDTSFGSFCIARGGSGGQGAGASNNAPGGMLIGGNGGSRDTTTACNGMPGGDGGNSIRIVAGSVGSVPIPGYGGSSFFAPQRDSGPTTINGFSNTGSNGVTGSLYGGGGSGGHNYPGQATARSGGAGAAGIVIVTVVY
jgi:hypothetical protein